MVLRMMEQTGNYLIYKVLNLILTIDNDSKKKNYQDSIKLANKAAA